VRLRKC